MYRPTQKFRIFLCILLLWCIRLYANAQEKGKIFSQYYSLNDYNAGEQNWDIAQDKNGIMYIGNHLGLLQYDGTNWTKYTLPNRSTVRTVEIAEDGKILVGGINEFGYFAVNKYGKLSYTSQIELIDSSHREFGDVWNVEIVNGSWFFQTDNYLFRIKDKKAKTWKNFGEYLYYNFNFNNELYLDVFGKGLYKLVKDSFVLLPSGAFFADKKIHSIMPYKDMMLIGTRSNGMYLYNPKVLNKIRSISEISVNAKDVDQFLIKNELYSGVQIEKDKFAISTISSGTIIIDNNFNVIDVINKESTGYSNSAYYVFYDDAGNLWLALDNGILKVELASPFRFWDEETGLLGSSTVICEFEKCIYNGTGRGVFMLEQNSPINKFGINKFHPVLDVDDQVWALMAIEPKSLNKIKKKDSKSKKVLGNYQIKKRTLIATTNDGLFAINKDKPCRILKYSNMYTVLPSIKDSSIFYLGLTDGLARIIYNNGVWYDDGQLPDYSQQTSAIAEDIFNNLWFSGGYKGVYRIKGELLDTTQNQLFSQLKSGVENFDTTYGLPVNELIQTYKVRDLLKYYTSKGEYIFNYTKNFFEKDKTIGKHYLDSTWKGEIYFDDNFTFWINAIEKNKKNGRYYADSLSIKRLKNYSLASIIRDSANRLWIGTSDGIICYQEKYKKNLRKKFPTIIRHVALGDDSVIYYGINFKEKLNIKGCVIDYSNKISYKPKISYKHNNISFNYSGTSYDAEESNEYSCLLEGYDKNWSIWNKETKKTYTNLSAGRYIFKVKAKNIYGIESSEASFSFEIAPPWYFTWWAYTIYIFLIMFAIILIVKLHAKELIKKNERLEKVVQLRTQEILTQNEEIIVQAEYLMDANEKINAKNEELESQKEELLKRKDQLEESEATRNKFFRIIAHDLRSPISSFANLTSFILENYDEFDTKRTKIVINELNNVSQITYNLLENLLEWSTNQMGEMRYIPKKLNFTDIIKDNIELIKSRLDAKFIVLTQDLPEKLEVFADENMLRTIIRNLLSNAVKFTYEYGKIGISSNIHANVCELHISDSGVGMSDSEIKKLFKIDKHFSNPGTQNEKGSGLGLILCQDFVEKNGGNLRVISTQNVGSVFTLSLPIG